MKPGWMGWAHRSDPASGRDGGHGAARLPQSVPEHCEGGSEGVERVSLKERCNWGGGWLEGKDCGWMEGELCRRGRRFLRSRLSLVCREPQQLRIGP